tara:strand:+ start:2975 stop:3256 length:282 start_codon:yes stop_codon:yes gene_type:complete
MSIKNIYPDRITAAQCRAARALLRWSQGDLAEKAKVGKQTLADFEREAREPYDRTLADIVAVLEEAGIEFIGVDDGKGPGVRLTEGRSSNLEH